MRARAILSALGAISPSAVLLALRSPTKARYLLSVTVREVGELRGKGLPVKDAIGGLCQRKGISRATLRLPVPLWDGGGTTVQEFAVLAAITSVMEPAAVFEIGTFSGLATTAFALNAPPTARVVTLDLPPGGNAREDYIPSDADLVAHRRVGESYRAHGLADRVVQLFGDSMEFDPAPYRDSIDLGFIDGAHTRAYVENDTRKMVEMMRPDGLILWHDYGGHGTFAGITEWLHRLAREAPLFREPYTSLAWAEAGPLKALLQGPRRVA